MSAGDYSNCFGPGATLDHAGLAVKSIHETAPALEITTDPQQKVRVAFFEMHGTRIELIEPLGADSPVAAILKRGPSVYHLCYRVPNLRTAIAVAQEHGFRPIGQPTPAPAFGGRPIAWVYHPSLGLFELVEA